MTSIDLETRSLLQALYFVSHGTEIPPEHAEKGFVTTTLDDAGRPFDWNRVMNGLFRVRWAEANKRPASAHVAIFFKGYWFYIDETDQDTKATFSLLMEMARLELTGKAGSEPLLTIPLSGR